MFIVSTLPYLLFGLVSGAIVDHFDRRRTLLTLDVARAFAIAFAIAACSYVASALLLWRLPLVRRAAVLAGLALQARSTREAT